MINSDLSCHNPKFTSSLANSGVLYGPNPSSGIGFCNNFEYFVPYVQLHEYGCTCRNVFAGTWLNTIRNEKRFCGYKLWRIGSYNGENMVSKETWLYRDASRDGRRGVEVQLHEFFSLGTIWSASRPAHFASGERVPRAGNTLTKEWRHNRQTSN
jgi:hypothetical protein